MRESGGTVSAIRKTSLRYGGFTLRPEAVCRAGRWFRWEYEDGAVEIEDFGNPELLAKAFADNGEVEVANVNPRFVHATLVASKSLGVGIAQPLDESGEVSDPLVFINLIDSGGSWKGTYSELADRLGVGVAE